MKITPVTIPTEAAQTSPLTPLSAIDVSAPSMEHAMVVDTTPAMSHFTNVPNFDFKLPDTTNLITRVESMTPQNLTGYPLHMTLSPLTPLLPTSCIGRLPAVLGLTSFQLVHGTGIVEPSMRHTEMIHPPPKDKVRIKGDTAAMVEDELERISVWVFIAVLDTLGLAGDVLAHPTAQQLCLMVRFEGSEYANPHNPYEDNTVLVLEPAVLNLLSLGLCIGKHDGEHNLVYRYLLLIRGIYIVPVNSPWSVVSMS